MIRHSIDLRIDRPAPHVFAFLTTAANHPRWDRSSVAMEQDQAGPWRTGTTFRELRRIGPRTVAISSRVAELEPGAGFVIRALSGPPFNGRWRVTPEGEGTLLRWTGEMHFSGLAWLATPLIAHLFRRDTDANFARLKRLLECSA